MGIVNPWFGAGGDHHLEFSVDESVDLAGYRRVFVCDILDPEANGPDTCGQVGVIHGFGRPVGESGVECAFLSEVDGLPVGQPDAGGVEGAGHPAGFALFVRSGGTVAGFLSAAVGAGGGQCRYPSVGGGGVEGEGFCIGGFAGQSFVAVSCCAVDSGGAGHAGDAVDIAVHESGPTDGADADGWVV